MRLISTGGMMDRCSVVRLWVYRRGGRSEGRGRTIWLGGEVRAMGVRINAGVFLGGR
jgi:hypothetical protein